MCTDHGNWAGVSRLPAGLKYGGGALLLLFVLFLLGPQLAPYAPNEQDLAWRLQSPDARHWFGTDNYGRDLFSRIVHAGRMDLQIAIVATCFASLVGISLGALAGFYEGILDALLMRLLDILIAFPDLVVVIAIAGLFEMKLTGLYIALSLVGWAPYARLVRGEILTCKRLEYVLAAKALGCGDSRLLWRHLLPHAISSSIVYVTSSVTFNILAITSLGYLGVGIQPPQAEWGAMIAEGRSFMLSSPGLVLYPSLMLILTGISFSLLGDGLAQTLQPPRQPRYFDE
ncbi:MAG TPA: ABC transporter permease [Anaerolineales bacterium]|nr:ABC transporter permease [Anaerolineales bacterium]